jgi:hypothetical protein
VCIVCYVRTSQPPDIMTAVISAVRSCTPRGWYTSYEPFMQARKR